MKKITTTLLLLCLMLSGYSQVTLDYSAKPKTEAEKLMAKGLSATSAYFLYEWQKMEAITDPVAKVEFSAKIQDRYGVQDGRVPALIVLADGRNPEELTSYDVTVGSSAGNIYTARIPVHLFAELAASGICKTIDVGPKNEIMMDNARENLGIDQIHAGLHLPHGYDGTGVVVGIIDQGFEFCHPSFYDSEGNLRVKRVWSQHDNSGTPPSGYNYGSEFTTEAQMMVAGYDMNETHGCHVSGIAAGSGAPSGDGTAYQGIATGADLVFVASYLYDSEICDAITYITNYAQSVGKPCVINQSFGTIIQSHDGQTSMDQFLNSFIEEHSDSLVLVASAGNNGYHNVHIRKQFSPTDTTLLTRLKYGATNDLNGFLILHGDNVFRVALSLINTNTQQQEDFTGFFTTN